MTDGMHEKIRTVTPPWEEEHPVRGDEFLSPDDLNPVQRDAAQRQSRRIIGEMIELTNEKKWEELIVLFHPVEEKIPELIDFGLDLEPRAKIAFAMGQVQKFDEAIQALSVCIEREPDRFHFHSSLAYTAYNSLYAAKNKEIFLSGKARTERIELAHRHFKRARELRPEGTTNFYREGMLFKQIEHQNRKALALFEKAVENWEALDQDTKKKRHQERKNYVKALYQYASVLLDEGQASLALMYMKRCLAEDKKSNHHSLVYKYFALGKIHYHLNDFSKAKDALLFAVQCKGNQPIDFVYELLARTYLGLGNTDRALEMIDRMPEKRRRPYCRWTEADVLCARGEFEKAKSVLLKSQERDTRSRHKALIRLSKIEYLLKNYESAFKHARDAGLFFNERWGGILAEALFWQSVCTLMQGDPVGAGKIAFELKAVYPRHPKLGQLFRRLTEGKVN